MKHSYYSLLHILDLVFSICFIFSMFFIVSSMVVALPGNDKGDTKMRKINPLYCNTKYNFLLLGIGAVNPFLSAFGITVLGLTAGNIAACYIAVQVSIFVLKPGIGYIADYFNKLKAIIVGLSALQLMFFLFIIIIPSTGMPGIDTVWFKDITKINAHCQMCADLDAFKLFTPKRYLSEDVFINISSSLGNNEVGSFLMDCSTDSVKSTKSINNSFEITIITYNFSYVDNLLAETYTVAEDAYVNKNFTSMLLVKTSLISFICLSPGERLFMHVNFSAHELNEYCFALSDKLNTKLQNLVTKSNITPVNCSDLQEMVTLQHKYENSISIANFKTYQFWLFAICLIFATAFGSSEFTMSDTACYESIQGIDYGRQRVWGLVGWGLSAPLAGYLNDYTGGYMASWGLCACFTVLQIWNLSRMNLVKPDFSQTILKNTKAIFSSIDFLCFEVGVFMNGMFTGIVWYYLTWFIVSIGGNKLLIGLANAIQNFIGGVPAMYFSGWLIKKLGHFNLVSLALISHGLRFFLYSCLHNPWWILPIESLHGFTFGSFYTAMTSYGKLNSKPGTEATTQAILSTTYEAMGMYIIMTKFFSTKLDTNVPTFILKSAFNKK